MSLRGVLVLAFVLCAFSAAAFAQGQHSVLKELHLHKGQDYSAAKEKLIGAGWKTDPDYVADAGEEGKKPYGFEDVVCGSGWTAVCSARFLRGNREIMLTMQPKQKLLLEGAWDDKQ